MQRNKRYRTYPFPYLADFSDDYLKTQFNLDVNYTSQENDVVFDIYYSINNEEISEWIKKKLIRVVAKISCVPMGFCKTLEFPSDSNRLEAKYDTMLLDGDVLIDAYLVSEETIDLTNQDLSDFWKTEKAIVEEHNIIGESNERVVTVTHAKIGSSKSIFKFVANRRKAKEDPYSVDLTNDDCIAFILSKESFESFKQIRNKRKEYVYSLYIIPALADILRQMINSPAEDGGEVVPNDFNIKYCNKRWYVVLQDKYRKAFGFDPTEGNKHPLEAAQEIIDKFTVINMLAKARKERD